MKLKSKYKCQLNVRDHPHVFKQVRNSRKPHIAVCECGARLNRAMRAKLAREAVPGYWERREARIAARKLAQEELIAKQAACRHTRRSGTECYCSFRCMTPDACTIRCLDCGATGLSEEPEVAHGG